MPFIHLPLPPSPPTWTFFFQPCNTCGVRQTFCAQCWALRPMNWWYCACCLVRKKKKELHCHFHLIIVNQQLVLHTDAVPNSVLSSAVLLLVCTLVTWDRISIMYRYAKVGRRHFFESCSSKRCIWCHVSWRKRISPLIVPDWHHLLVTPFHMPHQPQFRFHSPPSLQPTSLARFPPTLISGAFFLSLCKWDY